MMILQLHDMEYSLNKGLDFTKFDEVATRREEQYYEDDEIKMGHLYSRLKETFESYFNEAKEGYREKMGKTLFRF